MLLSALVALFLETVRHMSHQCGYHSLISNECLLILDQMLEQLLPALSVTVICWNLAQLNQQHQCQERKFLIFVMEDQQRQQVLL